MKPCPEYTSATLLRHAEAADEAGFVLVSADLCREAAELIFEGTKTMNNAAASNLDRSDWDGGGPYRLISVKEYSRLKASGEKVAWAEGCGYVAYDEQADREFRAALSRAGERP